MTQKHLVQRVALLKPSKDGEAIFYEIHTLVNIDGVEKRHRNADVTFPTQAEAEEWIAKQDHV
ncbi:hypothetical protein [uncultured Sulfitobacter sp.]|uniref:hypothetical protein n=1 Tax=uncultured Sulfitobacter sp. TaxID=191468 RepID=UPI00260BF209|nr:hypothetical protein [uncultured Sulfitobacter sp.]